MPPKVYLAAPFFNHDQLSLVIKLERLIKDEGWEMFSPRLGVSAQEMNTIINDRKVYYNKWAELIEKGGSPPELPPEAPSPDLRRKVFNDNWSNVDDSDLILAVIDDFDVGVMWEVGYAYRAHVPVVTHTGMNYGCNLMLAHSIIGHTKDFEAVADVLRIANPSFSLGEHAEEYGKATALIQARYKSEFALKEGPDERKQ